MTNIKLPETRYAQSGEISIAHQVLGDGPRDLVMIPGVISHVEALHELPGYTAFLRRLSTFGRVISFDKRGQGLSDRVAGVPTLDARMDDVRAVMEAVGSESAVLIGFSEGCAMSVLFAATYPDRVSHLVLLGGFPRMLTANLADDAFATFLDAVIRDWGKGRMMRTVVNVAETDATAIVQLGKIERLACSPGALKTLMQMNRRIDVTSILGNVRVPTLVQHSRADGRVPVAEGRKLAAGIPRARLIEYDGLPHGVWDGDFGALVSDIEEFVTGYRESTTADTERVLATVLFTDIVDSTKRAVELGDQRWRALLDRHDHIARQTIGAHRGKLVEIAGDGVLATFDGPGRAVRCALAFGSATQQAGIPLRAGLHTGEIELRGERVGGVAVHAAARVMAHAGANEVCVSRVVTDLVAGSGLRFVERGAFELKGLPGQWQLYFVSA